jgi:hypothetical protein
MACNDHLVLKLFLIIVGVNVISKHLFVDISYHQEWTHPFSLGVATFVS